MNLTLNNLNMAAGAKVSAPAAPSKEAAAAAPAPTGAQAQERELPAADTAAQPAQPTRAFAQWLGLEQTVPADAAPATADAAAPATETETVPDDETGTADAALSGAMAMPLIALMPQAQATLAALAAALPGMPANREAAPRTASASATATSTPEGEARGALAAVPVSLPPAAEAIVSPATPGASSAAAASPVAGAGTGSAGTDALAATDGKQDASAGEMPKPAAGERSPAAGFGISAPAPAPAGRAADSVALSGPPTAWRQTLQEALGDRLQLQVGKNAEQAVIRLEPPMLGRIEIAIRHSAGALEVQISATHGEVLRQLQSVSENLRNDLAQRQFTDVAVNIAPAPRGAATPQFGADQQGRGRQQDGREQDQTPGHALAEADSGTSPFSLNGRA